MCGQCTGAVPPTCTKDADCGPSCSTYRCNAGRCQLAICTPGQDQTCNENGAISGLAGTCNANGTCSCGPGYILFPDGKCSFSG
jgi:hypothetical protein